MDISKGHDYEPISSFTPVRRPDIPGDIAGPSPYNPAAAAWTASRCQRLLRPISARIARLRKERATPGQDRSQPTNPPALYKRSWSEEWRAEVQKLRGDNPPTKDNDDPEWAPDSHTSRPRTYAGGKASKRTRAGRPWSSNLASAARGNQDASGRIASTTGFDAYTAQRQRQPEQRGSSQHSHTYDGIAEGLDNLLLNTASSRTEPRQGAFSLFDMCLRAVPRRIALEQELILEDDPYSEKDASDTVYTELEELFGSTNGKGWKPLKLVARAHGVQMIADAVQEGLISSDSAWRYMYTCRTKAPTEAIKLVDAIIKTAKPSPQLDSPTVDRPVLDSSVSALILEPLREPSPVDVHPDDLFRSLSVGALPLVLLNQREWTNIMRGIFASWYQGGNSIEHVSTLVKTMLAQVCWDLEASPSDVLHAFRTQDLWFEGNSAVVGGNVARRLTTWVRSVLSSLLAFASLTDPQPPNHIWHLLHDIWNDIIVIRHTAELICHRLSPLENLHIAYIVLLWILLPDLNSDIGSVSLTIRKNAPCDEELLWMWTSAIDGGVNISAVSQFIVSVAQEYGVLTGQTAFKCARRMVDHLLAKSETVPWQQLEDPKTRAVHSLSQLAVCAAMDFADETAEPKHMTWALEIEDEYSIDTASSSKARMAGRFRWEESIGEWVIQSPAVSQRTVERAGQPLHFARPIGQCYGMDGCSEERDRTTPENYHQGSPMSSQIPMGTTLLDLTATPAQPQVMPTSPGCAVVVELPDSPPAYSTRVDSCYSSLDECSLVDLHVNEIENRPDTVRLHDSIGSVLSRRVTDTKDWQPKRGRGRPPKRKTSTPRESLDSGYGSSRPRKRARRSGKASLSGRSSKESSFMAAGDSSEDELGAIF